MINGAHVIIYSKDTEADKAFFRDVLKFPHVDVGRRPPDLPAAVSPTSRLHDSKNNDVHRTLADDR